MSGFIVSLSKSPDIKMDDNIKMDGISTKIKWKIHTLFILFVKLWGYFLMEFVRYSCQIVYFRFFLILTFISADIIFHKFLELYLTLSEKNIFATNLSSLTDSLNRPTAPSSYPPKFTKSDESFVSMLPNYIIIIKIGSYLW